MIKNMTLKLEQSAFHMMRKLFQAHTAAWQHAIPSLTKPQYAVLVAVLTHPGIEQVELIDVAVSTKATLAELLARLEKRALIYRQRGEQDKRRRFVYLTDEGRELLNDVLPVARAVDERFLCRLNESERDGLLHSLQVMNAPDA